jgi:uncharacterized membrane protein YjjP (DUF1212 family)
VPGSGRRRQATTPVRRRLRRDLLGWGLLAGLCAAVVLGLTGGGWVKALVLGLAVVGACAILTVLSATSKGPPKGPDAGSAP